MPAWVLITCAAALAQTLRFMLQKHLAATGLSAAGATFARFAFAAPVVAVGAVLYAAISGQAPGMPVPRFWLFTSLGGGAQILATVCVVLLFSLRNFAVGITLKKTEVLQTAVVGFVLLGELITPLGTVGIALGFAAVLVLSGDVAQGRRFRLDRSAGLGLLSGALFGVSGVSYRAASLSLESGDVALRAAITLAVVTTLQSIAMCAWFALRDPGQIAKVIRGWRVAGLVGLTSMIGSYCWFSAFTLQQAAYVNAVGQIELVFSALASMLVFGERITRREWIGMALLGASILIIILGLR